MIGYARFPISKGTLYLYVRFVNSNSDGTDDPIFLRTFPFVLNLCNASQFDLAE